jgi:hypothetical protein
MIITNYYYYFLLLLRTGGGPTGFSGMSGRQALALLLRIIIITHYISFTYYYYYSLGEAPPVSGRARANGAQHAGRSMHVTSKRVFCCSAHARHTRLMPQRKTCSDRSAGSGLDSDWSPGLLACQKQKSVTSHLLSHQQYQNSYNISDTKQPKTGVRYMHESSV